MDALNQSSPVGGEMGFRDVPERQLAELHHRKGLEDRRRERERKQGGH